MADPNEYNTLDDYTFNPKHVDVPPLPKKTIVLPRPANDKKQSLVNLI